MTSISVTLLWCVVQVTLFAIVAGVVYLLVRRVSSSSGAATLVGSLTLVLGLTLLATSPWPRWQFEAKSTPVASASSETVPTVDAEKTSALLTLPADATIGDTSPPTTLSPLVSAWKAFSNALANPQKTTAVEDSPTAWATWNILWYVAITCLLVSAARLAWGLVQVRGLLSRSRPIVSDSLEVLLNQLRNKLGLATKVALRESSDLPTPATVGWRTPTILLPTNWADWSAEEVETALAHELAHVAGRDYLSWIVARLTVAIHFYHPLVHWLASRLQLEQELAADATAVRLVGDRKKYLHSLASLALATPTHRIAGPARTLIPSRSLLMRRVEMLRTVKTLSTRPKFARMVRFLSLGLLASLAVAVAGVRQTATGQDAPTPPNTVNLSFATEMPGRIPLTVLPVDTMFVAAVRPALLINNDEALAERFNQLGKAAIPEGIDLSVSDVAEWMMIGYGDPDGQPRIVIRFTSSEACETALEYIQKMPGAKKFANGKWKTWRGNAEQFTQIDTSTLLIEHYADRKNQRVRPVENEASDWMKEWSGQWEAAKDRPVVAALDMRLLRLRLAADRDELLGGFPMQMFAPMFDHINWTVASVDLAKEGLKLDVLAKCDNEENALAVANTTQALMTLGGNVLQQQKDLTPAIVRQMPSEQAANMLPLIEKTLKLGEDFLAQAKPLAEGQRVSLSFDSELFAADQLATSVQALLPALQDARAAARRTQSINNLKQLALAMLNYEATYGHFPPAVIKKEGQPPHSWRVAILPFLEQQTSYEQYEFDEPWDSETNKKVLAQMPAVFRSSQGEKADSTNSSYFALTGHETVFADDLNPTRFADIRDGSSMTLLLVEAKRDVPVPWTKPEDIPYDSQRPLPELGGYYSGIFNAAMCDGSVRAISTETEEKNLRAWITKEGGETVPHPGAK
ncbi:MAG: DUF1559 domain-containing protein [Aeoliella sp.]